MCISPPCFTHLKKLGVIHYPTGPDQLNMRRDNMAYIISDIRQVRRLPKIRRNIAVGKTDRVQPAKKTSVYVQSSVVRVNISQITATLGYLLLNLHTVQLGLLPHSLLLQNLLHCPHRLPSSMVKTKPLCLSWYRELF